MRNELGYLRHPLSLSMLALWIVNDHLLKGWYGNAWTGKLSDVAGLIVFPLFLFALFEVFVSVERPRRALLTSITVAGVFFVGLNTSDAFSDSVCLVLGGLQWPLKAIVSLAQGGGLPSYVPTAATPDLTDLYTLPALWLAWHVGTKHLNVSTDGVSHEKV